ncbi:translocation/assembly module TamB domain-containing protein [Pseudanabaena mucicola]|uniref:Translocation/assembly module TamB domain-containing protein n=1 Tax=Pseudanabaena mucicola FACHB-723 TaxID=2692860 RepID=A0ABR7ZVJ4_9CYAN|nr:translocation/assembly module TamB domain-containing protein [Pseudanabaena mucicola]MBD2187423.1 translocation/assembly module TamB domain-containing protein [Pseudanabaena mucicola FACHB-723]
MGQAQLPPQEPSTSTLAKNLGRVGVGLAIAFTATSLGAFWYGRYFLNEQLSPLLQTELSKALKRPLQLGKVERVGWSSVRFGKSIVPPTAEESNFLATEAIEVKVDLWTYLTRGQIGLDAIAEQPQLFLKQDVSGFLQLPKITPPEPQTKDGLVDLRTITFSDAQLTIQTIAKGELVSLSQMQIDSKWQIANLNDQSLQMSGKGRVTLPNLAAIAAPPDPAQLKTAIATANAAKDSNQGNVSFNLDWDLTKGQGTIKIQSQDLQAAAIQGFAIDAPVEIKQGKLNTEATISIIAEQEAPTIAINAQLSDGVVKSPQLTKNITGISGQFNFDGKNATIKDLSAEYGLLKTNFNGTFNEQKGFNLDFSSPAIDLAKAIESFDIKTAVAIAGEVKLDGKFTGTAQKPSLKLNIITPKTVSFDRIVVDRFLAAIELNDLNTLQIKRVQALSTGATLTGAGQIILPKKDKPAEIRFNSTLVGVAEKFADLYGSKLPINVGQVNSTLEITGALSNPQILAQIDAPNASYPTRGEVLLIDGLATIRNTKVRFPIGELGLAGTYNIASGIWQSQLSSNGIPLSAFFLNQKGIVEGLINLRSDRGGFNLADITADGNLRLPQGFNELPDLITTNLKWDGRNLLVPSLQVGNYLTANGKVDLAFPNNAPNQLPTGIAGIDLNLISQNVNINRLASLSSSIPAQASGILNFRGRLSGAIDKLKIAGALQLDRVDLASFASSFAKQGITAPSRGSLDFDGSINGDLAAPQLAGNLRVASLKVNQIELDNLNFNGTLNGISSVLQATGDLLLAGLRIDQLAFDPRLEGNLAFNGNQGLTVDLRGKRDRIAARFDSAFRPIDFNANLGEATATGKRLANNPNRLQIAIANVPLALAASLAGQNDVSGKLSSNLVVDFGNNPTAVGDVIITRPRFGRVIAEQAVAKIYYANGIFDIKDGNVSVRQGEINNDYRFRLTYNPAIDEPLAGVIEVSKGRIQDVFATLQWANLVDVTQGFSFEKDNASDLQPLTAIKLLGEPLYKQLQYLTQIELRQEQQEIADSNRNFNLPPLTDFRGDIQGQIAFGFNKTRGIRLGFDVVGKNFEYGKFAIDDIQLEGRYFNGVFAIAKANFQSDQSYGRITKAFLRLAPASNPLLRIREQSGEIELKNFPIESLRPLPFFSVIPFDLTGNVDGNLSITGTTLLDTKIAGDLSLNDGSVNRQPIDSIAVKFNYALLNINFDANMKVDGKERVLASGNVGVLGNFDVKLDVKDEGIAFVNIFNQPVRWMDGKGNINLRANGTFRDPKIAGKMTVDNAKVRIAGLPGDFTEVQGDINFTSDRLVSNINSNFSDGKLSLKGILAISDEQLLQEGTPEYAEALAINADKLKLSIRDISSENFNTRVIVRGSLLTPILTGEVLLDEGRFVIGNDAEVNGGDQPNGDGLSDIAFDRLAVTFRNMQVTRFPLFNFLGEGTMIVNGTFQKPEPSGKIQISRGQFNAISTRFRLDRSYENFVEFKPSQGLNPSLNVRVAGAVAETTRVPINSNRPDDLFSPNEIPVSNLGAQRTLRVQATVLGTALAPDISLSSSPPRSQTEILALIGGGVLQQQGGADPASALASFAGGTVLNFLQDAVGDALNLAEFNLSPVVTNTEGGGARGALGLSAEAAIDISNSFSVALQRVINDSSQPTNFSIRYRVDPNILLRGNYGTNGSTGISIEYENRF